jgi:SpoVK/Ycf46/Vps4 family AAA+-type ATPase
MLASVPEFERFDAHWRVLRSLRLPRISLSDTAACERMRADICVTLKYMEARASRFKLSSRLETNLHSLGRVFSLTSVERQILALAVLLRIDDVLCKAVSAAVDGLSAQEQIATVLRLPVSKVVQPTSPDSVLIKCNLITVHTGSDSSHRKIRIPDDSRLPMLAYKKIASPMDLFSNVLHSGGQSTLQVEDYSHLRPDMGFILRLLDEALKSGRRGLNLLFHGPPGTGKTQCARLLAQELGASLHEVSGMNEWNSTRERLKTTLAAQRLLRGGRALLLFDEADALFNDGSRFWGRPSTADSIKAWVNELLEANTTPMIWIMNGVSQMDPAFVRRFDLVVKIEAPPLQQRQRLLERLCGDVLDAAQIRRFAQVEAATPAVMARAVNVIRRVQSGDRPRAALLETVLDGTLAAQGHASVRRSCQVLPPTDYDVALCNADTDLNAVAQGIARSRVGRICLYGPPGTGKTAFGHWLATTLDAPLMLKRVSDIQSPFIGVMEKNLARAFQQAERDGAVLQIDEVDTFLQDRQSAQRQWEISQTNEFLTQLESFTGVFIASTNLMEGLDQAVLRRFDYKIKVGYLRTEQAQQMLGGLLREWNLPAPDAASAAHLASMTCLTPGDFALLRRRHAVVPFADAVAVLNALRQEVGMKRGEARRIGFV